MTVVYDFVPTQEWLCYSLANITTARMKSTMTGIPTKVRDTASRKKCISYGQPQTYLFLPTYQLGKTPT